MLRVLPRRNNKQDQQMAEFQRLMDEDRAAAIRDCDPIDMPLEP